MNKLKYLILVISVFMLVGCDNNYTLTVSDDEITEDINVTIDNTQENRELLDLNYYPLHANDQVFYEKSVTEYDDYLTVNLKYTYSLDEFSNANSFNQCFDDKEILLNNDEYYYLKFGNMNGCVSEEYFDINIKTKNKVLMNNADSVNGDTYTWHVTEDNKENLLIEIKIAKGKSARDNSYIGYILVGIAVIVIVVFIRLFIARKNSRDDF